MPVEREPPANADHAVNRHPDAESTFDALSAEQMLQVNKYCDQFEKQWRETEDASLEAFSRTLRPMTTESAAVLHLELATMDIQYRRQFGHRVSVKDYHRIFPSLANLSLAELAGHPDTATKSRTTILTTGQRIGDYVIEACIGQGGMGQVYRARHELMGREVAIKVLLDKVRGDELAQRRFEREVRSVAKMSHPNVVAAFDAREAEGMLCLVTEWIDGNTLADLVKANGPLPVEEALECTIQAGKGLQYAHQKGFIHRDVKPSNLLLDHDGNIKVLDLGLAKLQMGLDDDEFDDAITKTDHVVGTAQFLSPEQARSPGQIDARSDIYSLGCSLFFLLTGNPPYSGDTPLDTMLSHISAVTPKLNDVTKSAPIPRRLSEFVASMMAKQPSDRPESMEHVITELQSIQAGIDDVDTLTQDSRPTPLSQPPPPRETLVPSDHSNAAIAKWVACIVAVSLLSFAGWRISQSFKQDSHAAPSPPDTASILFDGESSYANVENFNVPISGPAMIEVMVTPNRGSIPANVVTWSGHDILVLFAASRRRWGIALRHNGQSHLEISDAPYVDNQTYLLAAHWDGSTAQLWVDGEPIETSPSNYPLVASETALCFGGVADGLLPMDQGTRFFRGKIHKIRLSKSPLPAPARNESEMVNHDSCVALFNLEEGKGNQVTDASKNHWIADLYGTAWDVTPTLQP